MQVLAEAASGSAAAGLLLAALAATLFAVGAACSTRRGGAHRHDRDRLIEAAPHAPS